MGTGSGRLISVPVSTAFLLRCFNRWRNEDVIPSLREAAKGISLIDKGEAERRRIENGDAIDLSGLRISYQTVVNIDVQMREIVERQQQGEPPPATVQVGLISYLLISAWMGEAPALPNDDPRITAVANLWRIIYNEERRRQGKIE